MNIIEKEKIRYWRGEGLGYKAVAAKVGVTESAVKGFCKRSGMGGGYEQDACRQCGKPLERIPRGGQKKFCGDVCRNAWWNAHPYLREANESNRRVCVQCGGAFYFRPSVARKYCGRPCYIAARFGKDVSRYDV